MNPKFMTSAEAGRVLGMTRHGVRHLILTGTLKAVKFGRSYMIEADTVSAAKKSRRGRGRPAKAK